MFLKNKSSIAAFIACLVIMIAYLVTQISLVSGLIQYKPWLGYFGLICIGLFFPLFIFLVSSYLNQIRNSKKGLLTRELELEQHRLSEIEKFIDEASIISKADSKGKITYVNKKFTEVSGYRLEEVVGKDHNIVNSGIHPKDMWKNMYQTVIKDKGIWNQVVTNRAKNGSLYHVDTYIKADFDQTTGQLLGYSSIRQDLTELKNKEQEIRNRMNAINKSNAVVEFSLDRKIIYANQNFCELFGYQSQEIIGSEHQLLVRDSYAKSEEYEAFWKTLSLGKYLNAEYERVKKDGDTIWLQASYNPVLDTQGKVVRVMKIATDVTERVRQQREIEAQRKRFEELLNFVDEAAIVSKADGKGKITYVNKKFTQVSGYTLEEVVGKDHNIVNSGVHSKEMWTEMYKKVIKDKGIWNQVVTNRAKNGRLYYVDTYIKGEFNPATGALIEYTSIRQDLTDLKSKELEIVNRMNAINKSNAVIEFDMDGNIMYANDQFCKILGYTMEELRGKHHQMFVSRSYAETIDYLNFWDTLRKGRHISSEFERLRKDGQTVWLQATYNPIINNEGLVKRVIKIAVDITDRIKQSDEIQKKNTYLEHAAKILRHDMHSGINVYIPRGIKSLKLRLSEESIENFKLDPALRMLQEGLSHAQKVYKGVFEFTNLVKTDAKLKLTELNLGDILRDFISTTAYKNQVLIGDLTTTAVSEQLFCTAVDNLIRNGLKYNDSQKKLVKVYMADPDTLAVEDNGRGITQEEFINFSSKNLRRENQKESGSGLGLGICVAILKEHNFQIHCRKNETIGSTISIKLR